MNELITISTSTIDGQEQQTVNARDLHTFLEVGKDFSNWIKDRIKKFAFVEGTDYVKASIQDIVDMTADTNKTFDSPNLANQKGGDRRSIEYFLSLDMAKELSMVERNEKGKQARQYFIQCEKIAKEKMSQPVAIGNMSRIDLAQMVIAAETERLALVEKNTQLTEKIKEDAPKVIYAKQVIASEDTITVSQAAKILDTGRTRLFAFLRQIGWVTRKNEPYQRKIKEGLLDVKLGSWEHPNHSLRESVTTMVTGKGLAALQSLYSQRAVRQLTDNTSEEDKEQEQEIVTEKLPWAI